MRWLLTAAALLWSACAWAHKPSDSYLRLTLSEGSTIEGRWDIALRDLEVAIGVDADGNGDITWGELSARHADIAAYALARLVLRADGQPCSLRAGGAQQVDEHTDGRYTVLPFTATCAAIPKELEVGYSLFAEIDPLHRGLLSLTAGGATRSAVLDPQAEAAIFELAATSRWSQFGSFVKDGVWHIWIGLDHILFLLSLLLPAVLTLDATRRVAVREAARWVAVNGFRAAFIDVLKVVTAFTLAHSITLTLATLGVVQLPSRLVESTIAASVVLAALNNMRPFFGGRRWAVAFGFGLLHGFGFASVLADLALPQDALVLSLLGFNLGVELGQLTIVGVFLPLAYALRGSTFYRRWLMTGGSALIALLAAAWLIERAFGVVLLPSFTPA